MIVDTSALLAYFDCNEARHHDMVELFEGTKEACVVSPYVVAELDYLIATRFGRAAEVEVMDELNQGDWQLASIDADCFQEIVETLHRYDEAIGVADASNIILATRFSASAIATLDHRHYSYLSPRGGIPLTVVP